ncbi:MAG: hypothetical protein V4642_15370 [Bacteroidota bacterium]
MKGKGWAIFLIVLGALEIWRSAGLTKIYGVVLFIVGVMSWMYITQGGFKNISGNSFKKPSEKPARNPSLEPAVLRAAREKFGVLTPALLAVECNITIEEASAQLEYLAARGICTIEVNSEGRVYYHFPDFLPPHS